MKIVIVEDEQLAAEKLADQLTRIAADIEVVKVLESVESAVNWFSLNPSPDLVFMDIQLEDGISFEIFDAIKLHAPVIFTTAYDEYAIRAFKVNSVDYLLKPIGENDLKQALQKFKKIFDESDFASKVTRVIEQVSKRYKTRFFMKVGTRFQSIKVADICCFFVEERNTFLKTTGGKTYDIDHSLDQLQGMVDPEQFFRINRNYLVNINCISEIISYSTTRLKLKLEVNFQEDLIVSRDRVTEFKHWMDK
ncbi:LytR/AlgR family response regulator transcription factor [Maribellus sediminis]|uniref:LytR/AlgR family response regulator transcription factor n=1 Tax=Maribellus sediminis TaxID=2696285 RepID=UPI001430B628|nr:LytTR family DNA-binding domain-containing protein [Maribellus sediminis]